MTNSDKLLERLVKRVNESGKLFDVTLIVSGATVTGKLAPRSEWLKTGTEGLDDTSLSEFSADFRAEAAAFDNEEYLHLSGGKVVAGQYFVPTNGGLTRIPVAAVDGWMVGRFQIDHS